MKNFKTKVNNTRCDVRHEDGKVRAVLVAGDHMDVTSQLSAKDITRIERRIASCPGKSKGVS